MNQQWRSREIVTSGATSSPPSTSYPPLMLTFHFSVRLNSRPPRMLEERPVFAAPGGDLRRKAEAERRQPRQPPLLGKQVPVHPREADGRGFDQLVEVVRR